MPETKEVIVDKQKFIIGSLNVGEVEQYVLADARDDKPSLKEKLIENPRAVVVAGLKNGGHSLANGAEITEDWVKKLSWSVYKKLQEEILDFTGFPKATVTVEKTAVGEAAAGTQ